VNVDPFDARLDDELEPRPVAEGLHARPAGDRRLCVADSAHGRSGRILDDRAVVPASERLYLIPGDSPMGLRLPLDSLPWSSLTTVSRSKSSIRSRRARRCHRPNGGRIPRPPARGMDFKAFRIPRTNHRVGTGDRREAEDATRPFPRRGESAGRVVRSALCVEPRGGVLYIFMPPAETIEDYLDLVGAIEATSRALGMRVMLEGYPPAERPAAAAFPGHSGSGAP